MDACNNPEILRVIMFIITIIKVVFYLIPIGLILMMAFDFFKNIIAGKDSEMSKNTMLSVKRIVFCAVLFLVPSVVSLVIDVVDSALGTDNNYLSCVTNANSDTIVQKQTEYAESLLDEALLSNSYSKIDDALVYINKLTDESLKAKLTDEAEKAKSAILDEVKQKIDEESALHITTVVSNAGYYYENMESPDSKEDYKMYVDPDPGYVSRAVEVTDAEKQIIISTIAHEMGACKSGAVHAAQTIRDTYLYLSAFNSSSYGTITSVIKNAFSPVYIYNLQTTEYAEFAFDYVFVKGNSFYPRKLVGERSFVVSSSQKGLGYYEVFRLNTHYDNGGSKRYITDPSYMYSYNLGNTNLDSGGKYADYVNPNAKTK